MSGPPEIGPPAAGFISGLEVLDARDTSWAFGRRLREAGLRGSMDSVGDAYDNSMAGSFFASLQTELLDRQRWKTRAELAQAIFEHVEGFYKPTRRHSSLGMLSPNDFEHQHTTSVVTTAA